MTINDKILSDREFWLLIRRALLLIVQAIERKYLCKESPVDIIQ